MEAIAPVDRRRRNLQVILFLIILATLPFYCAGFVLLGTAPGERPTPTPRATTPPVLTRTLATATRIAFPSITPLPGGGGNLQPTPPQFFPPPAILPTVAFPTAVLPTATTFIFPTATTAPTLTLPPTQPPPPLPTDTPIPIATDTPFVFASATPVPVPDSDGDGVPDNFDLCPGVPGLPPTGCPPTPTATETILPPGP